MHEWKIAVGDGFGNHAPHGGPIVLPAVINRVPYVIAIVAGTAVTAASINLLKRLTEARPAERREAP